MYGGLLNDTLTPQTRTLTQNSLGEQVETWADGSDLACRFQDLSFKDVKNGRIDYAEATHQAFVNYITTLTVNGTRIKHNSIIYDLVGVDNLGGEKRRTRLVLRIRTNG